MGLHKAMKNTINSDFRKYKKYDNRIRLVLSGCQYHRARLSESNKKCVVETIPVSVVKRTTQIIYRDMGLWNLYMWLLNHIHGY